MELTKEQKEQRLRSIVKYVSLIKGQLVDMYQLMDGMDYDTRMEVRDNISTVKDELNAILCASKWQFKIKE
jgi:hypothetical protein|tara:strand:- start:19 stop:231 length:213 start_codon:yes stop_codon:yes gene_type:complete